MEKILIFIKHNFGFLWIIIEGINNSLFNLLYSSKLQLLLPDVIKEFGIDDMIVRKLVTDDTYSLFELITSQQSSDLKYFKPHGFDRDSIRKQFAKRSFLMMGVFDKDKMIGYFFLRFFANKKCFVGRLIDMEYRGKGIGNVMNNIMYNIAWRMDFRCLSTISKNNKAVIGAHKNNSNMIVLKELQNNYLLVEFVKEISDKMKS